MSAFPDLPRSERFEIVRQLGAGGMGVVYEALDRQQGMHVALKTLRHLNGRSLLHLKSEYRSLQDLQHPNLISLGDLVEESGSWFFTMELVRGVDFLRYVRGAGSAGRLDEQRLRESLRQLAQGLVFLHAAGKVHRDLKPSNVLIDDSGRVVILDLGLVYDMGVARHSTEGQPVGTAEYMSPEQGVGERIGPESDWYSVGVILYQALTGRLPHAGPALAVMLSKQRSEPPPASSLARNVPADLDQLCGDLLRIEPSRRPREEEIVRRLVSPPSNVPRPPAAPVGEGRLFVGRGAELELLREAFREAREGRPRTVLVRGDSGVGKSALVRRFVETLPSEALVLAGRCYERESVPFRAVDGAVDALSRYLMRLPREEASALLPRMAPLLAQLFPVLLRVEAIALAPRPQLNSDPHEIRRRAADALRELHARIADRRPLVVVVDDLQWADADSLWLLGEILREPDAPAILFVGIARSLSADREWTAHPKIVEIGPLPRSEAQDLAALLLRRSPGVEHVDACAVAQAAAGHPLFIYTLVRHASGQPHREVGRLALDEALWSDVEGLPADARTLLGTLSLASVPLKVRTAFRAAGLTAVAASSAMTTLRARHLLRVTAFEDLEPYHDRVRETVLAHLSAETARAGHERLALALTAEPETPAEALAVHWRGAGNRGRAAEFAQRAADQSYETLAFARAARLYEMTLELLPEAAQVRSYLLRRLGDSFLNAGRGAEAAAAYLSAKTITTGLQALELQRLRVDCLLASGRIDEGMVAVQELLAAVGLRFPKSRGRALALAIMKLVWLKIRGYDFVPRPEAAIASVELARIDACQSVGNGLNIVDVFHAIHFSARALVLGLRVGEPKRIAVSLAHHAVGLSVEGGSRSAARSGRVLERARTIAESTGDARTKALVRLHAGSAAFVEGRFADARLLLESAEREFVERHPGTFWEVNSARTLLLVVNYHLGDIKALLRGGTTWLREAEQRGDVLLALSAVNWPAHLRWLALDDPDEARERLTAAISMWTRRTYQLQHWATLLAETDIDIYERVPGRARIRFREHERPLRRSLMLRSQVARTQHFESRARATLADAASQQGSARRELLEQARMDARGIERAGAPWGMGLTALLEGSVEQLRGRPDLAVVRLRRALAAFESTGQTLHAAVTRWRLGELVGGDEGASLRSQGRQFIVDAGFLSPGRLLDILSPGFASA